MIADDDALARAVIEAIVKRDPELELIGSANDAPSAMPGGGGPAAAREILLRSPETKIVALTASDGQEAEIDMLRAGARSVLVKGCPPDELLRTVRAAMSL
jgi:DNA-binding NarL/FixJ family response regulator